jgi:hypothetical protein
MIESVLKVIVIYASIYKIKESVKNSYFILLQSLILAGDMNLDGFVWM